MTRFTPDGEFAQWRIIYDVLRESSVGDIVTYETLGEALGVDPSSDRQRIQLAARRAFKEFLSVDSRATENIPNEGYRIVEAGEHMRLARKQSTKATKALARGRDQVTHVDFNGMAPEVRQGFEMMAQGFSAVIDMNRRLSDRQDAQEEALKHVSVKSDRTEAELEELRTRLSALESEKEA